MLEDLSAGFVELKKDEIVETISTRITQGDDATKLLEDARLAMTVVGDRFQDGSLFLAEMMLSAEIFKEVIGMLKPHLDKARPPEPIGTIVLATPRGDIHDLGKDIFATLLEGQGFEVHNLGVDVEPSLVVEKVKEVTPDLVGFSALITTAFASMKETTDILEDENMRDSFKLMVGGGVTTTMLKEHIGADFQTIDAMEGVSYCLKTMHAKNPARSS
ncbi:MAG: cobalamin-binding protein [Deltaproteobacteria bacterium]|nr:MAG: cobalamin-binding protein [Deltaproteobacteria bacterium]